MSNLRLIQGGKEYGGGGGHRPPNPNVKGVGMVDYIWPQQGLPQCRKRAVALMKGGSVRDASDTVPIIEVWGFWQRPEKEGPPSQFALNPCFYLPDPTRPRGSFLAICEVKTLAGDPVETNHRATLRATHVEFGGVQDTLDTLGSTWGFTQSYRILSPGGEDIPLAQASLVFEYHLGACLDAGIQIASADPVSATKGVWTFEISGRGFPESLDPDPANPLIMADQLMLARHLLVKAALDKGYMAAFGGSTILYSNEELSSSGDPHPLLDLLGQGDEGTLIIPEQGWDLTKGKFAPNRIIIGTGPADDPYLSASKVLAKLKDSHAAETK